MKDSIQSKINMLKLLGFQIKKHVFGYYVVFDRTDEIHSVYTADFESIAIGNIEAIEQDFIVNRNSTETRIYSKVGKLLDIAENEYHVMISNRTLYVSGKDNAVNRVILRNDSVIQTPSFKPYYVPVYEISNGGDIYTISEGIIYKGEEVIDTLVSQVGFNSHYYIKCEDFKCIVYDLDTHIKLFEDKCNKINTHNELVLLRDRYGKVKLYRNNKLLRILSDCSNIKNANFVTNNDNTSVLIDVTFGGGMHRVADLDGNFINNKTYYYVSRYVYCDCMVTKSSTGKWQIIDVKGNLVLEADSISTSNYGFKIYNGEEYSIMSFEQLEELLEGRNNGK